MDQFVCVRLVQMGGVDLAQYQFDPFLSWSVMFLHADKTIYGRFGTASPKANRNKKDSNPNHTLAGLKAALSRALELHQDARKDPTAAKALFAGKTGTPPPWRYAEATPAARKYKRLERVKGEDTKGCVHCHVIQQSRIDSYLMTKQAVPDRELWLYPHPEIVGITLSKDHCARVEAVAPDSIAARGGIRPGDDIVGFDGQPLCSVADVQWVLHNVPDKGGTLETTVQRGDERLPLELKLAPGWRREGDWAWRYRVAGYAMWLWGGVTLKDSPEGVRVAQPAPWWFKRENKQAKRTLKVGDVLQMVDGREGWTRSTYLAYLMREKKPGSTVKLVVLRDGKPTKVSFKVPKPRPEVMGH